MLLLITTFPSFLSQSKSYSKILTSIPKVMLKAFGISAQNKFTLLTYLGGKYIDLLLPLILIFFIVSFVNSQIVGQIEDKTIGLVLSLPISRLKIFISKYISGIIALIIFIIFAVISIIPLASIENFKYSTIDIYLISILTFIFGISILSFSFFISSLFSSRGKSTMVISSTIFVMYVFNVVYSLSSSLKSLKYFSIFYYYNINYIFQNNNIDISYIIVFSFVFVIFFLLGLFVFRKRDIDI
ncbi:ABC transporter permease subunit [Patescibacteria group bacterium]|nr:ABC transporter permease subunit [Patescibacteria group bacterium]